MRTAATIVSMRVASRILGLAAALALAIHAQAAAGGVAAMPSGPMRLIITGPPGSGKGETSKLLSKEFGLVHVAAGDLLRQYAKTDPATAAIMNRGDLVPAKLVVRLVSERLAQ